MAVPHHQFPFQTKGFASSKRYLKVRLLGRLNADHICPSEAWLCSICVDGASRLADGGHFARCPVCRSTHCQIELVVLVNLERRVHFGGKVVLEGRRIRQLDQVVVLFARSNRGCGAPNYEVPESRTRRGILYSGEGMAVIVEADAAITISRGLKVDAMWQGGGGVIGKYQEILLKEHLIPIC